MVLQWELAIIAMKKTNWFPLCFILSVGVVLNVIAAVNYYGNFIGDGSQITSLNGSQITSGTVPDARLSANVPLLNANNTFTAINAFNSSTTFGSGGATIDNSGNGTFASIAGSGSGITSLNANNLSSGSVPQARLLGAGLAFTNTPAIQTWGNGNVFLGTVWFGGPVFITNNLAWTTNSNLRVTNALVVDGPITNNGPMTTSGGVTNSGTTYFGSSQQFSISSSGVSSGDLSGGTNITYQYETNQTGSTTLNWGQCYMTNIAAAVTLSLQSVTASPEAQKYRTIVYFVTNATASDFKITCPSGVIGPVGSGTPSGLYATNKTLTRLIFEHAGPNWITVSKTDFGN